jgi:hypothetical protein
MRSGTSAIVTLSAHALTARVRLRVPRPAANTSDSNPAAAVAPIVADTQSKLVGGDGSRAIGADAAIVLSSWPPHARNAAYSFAADTAIEDGGGGTADGSQAVAVGGSMIGRASAAGATTAAVTASAASMVMKRIWTSLRIGDRRVRSIEGQRPPGR